MKAGFVISLCLPDHNDDDDDDVSDEFPKHPVSDFLLPDIRQKYLFLVPGPEISLGLAMFVFS